MNTNLGRHTYCIISNYASITTTVLTHCNTYAFLMLLWLPRYCIFSIVVSLYFHILLHLCKKNFAFNHIPRSRPLTNCSSSAGSTLAVFFLFSYLRCALFDRFLLIRASSSALCNNINMLTTFLQWQPFFVIQYLGLFKKMENASNKVAVLPKWGLAASAVTISSC